MLNFEFKNPTKIIFGKDTIKQVTTQIPTHAKVLLLYGGGSIKKNGIYEEVLSALTNFEVFEFGGLLGYLLMDLFLDLLLRLRSKK